MMAGGSEGGVAAAAVLAQHAPCLATQPRPHLQRDVLGPHHRALQALQVLVLLLHHLLLQLQEALVAQLGGRVRLAPATRQAAAAAAQQRVARGARRLALQRPQHLLPPAAQLCHQVAPPVPLVLGAAIRGLVNGGGHVGVLRGSVQRSRAPFQNAMHCNPLHALTGQRAPVPRAKCAGRPAGRRACPACAAPLPSGGSPPGRPQGA